MVDKKTSSRPLRATGGLPRPKQPLYRRIPFETGIISQSRGGIITCLFNTVNPVGDTFCSLPILLIPYNEITYGNQLRIFVFFTQKSFFCVKLVEESTSWAVSSYHQERYVRYPVDFRHGSIQGNTITQKILIRCFVTGPILRIAKDAQLFLDV